MTHGLRTICGHLERRKPRMHSPWCDWQCVLGNQAENFENINATDERKYSFGFETKNVDVDDDDDVWQE